MKDNSVIIVLESLNNGNEVYLVDNFGEIAFTLKLSVATRFLKEEAEEIIKIFKEIGLDDELKIRTLEVSQIGN